MTARRDIEPAPLAALRPGALVYWWDRRTGGRRLGTVASAPQEHRRGPATVRVHQGDGSTREPAGWHSSANAREVLDFPADVLHLYQAPEPVQATPQATPEHDREDIAPRVSSTIPTSTETTTGALRLEV